MNRSICQSTPCYIVWIAIFSSLTRNDRNSRKYFHATANFEYLQAHKSSFDVPFLRFGRTRVRSCLFVHLRPLSSTFVHFRTYSSTFVHLRSVSLIFVYLRLSSFTFVHLRVFLLLTSSIPLQIPLARLSKNALT